MATRHSKKRNCDQWIKTNVKNGLVKTNIEYPASSLEFSFILNGSMICLLWFSIKKRESYWRAYSNSQEQYFQIWNCRCVQLLQQNIEHWPCLVWVELNISERNCQHVSKVLQNSIKDINANSLFPGVPFYILKWASCSFSSILLPWENQCLHTRHMETDVVSPYCYFYILKRGLISLWFLFVGAEEEISVPVSAAWSELGRWAVSAVVLQLPLSPVMHFPSLSPLRPRLSLAHSCPPPEFPPQHTHTQTHRHSYYIPT